MGNSPFWVLISFFFIIILLAGWTDIGVTAHGGHLDTKKIMTQDLFLCYSIHMVILDLSVCISLLQGARLRRQLETGFWGSGFIQQDASKQIEQRLN